MELWYFYAALVLVAGLVAYPFARFLASELWYRFCGGPRLVPFPLPGGRWDSAWVDTSNPDSLRAFARTVRERQEEADAELSTRG